MTFFTDELVDRHHEPCGVAMACVLALGFQGPDRRLHRELEATFVDRSRFAPAAHIELKVKHLAERPEPLHRRDLAATHPAHELRIVHRVERRLPSRHPPGTEGRLDLPESTPWLRSLTFHEPTQSRHPRTLVRGARTRRLSDATCARRRTRDAHCRAEVRMACRIAKSDIRGGALATTSWRTQPAREVG